MRRRLCFLMAVAAALAVIPATGIAEVVLFDDFEDGILDETLWSAPGGGVYETHGICQLTDIAGPVV